jgi:hypothetical protein
VSMDLDTQHFGEDGETGVGPALVYDLKRNELGPSDETSVTVKRVDASTYRLVVKEVRYDEVNGYPSRSRTAMDLGKTALQELRDALTKELEK